VISVLTAAASSLLLLFLATPILGLATAGSSGLPGALGDRDVVAAVVLTIIGATAAVATGMLLGTPLAWVLARRRFRGRALVAAILDLPLLIPHPVAGIALLLLLGRNSPLGSALLDAGIRFVGTPLGIVAAMLFVSVPLYVSGAREAFARVDERYEGVARSLGDSPWRAFRRVTLPLAARGLTASAIVMWARAVSEFGAIVIIAYHPRVASVLIYDRFATYGLDAALPVAAALLLVSLVPLVLLRVLHAEPALGERRAVVSR
jgi:molybdate/tungstate transport system permease protein